MSKRVFPESELIINNDGSCFHLHLRPEQLADRVILVGDQDEWRRLPLISTVVNVRSAVVSSIPSLEHIKASASRYSQQALVVTILISS